MFKIGQVVAVLDDDLIGKIVSMDKNSVHIETTDGFLMKFQPKDLVVHQNLKQQIHTHTTNISAIALEKEQNKRKNNTLAEQKSKQNETVLEVDLHIEKLVNSTKGMDNYDILNLQIATAKSQLNFAIRKRIQKVIFIHGVGEGVLKQELLFTLKHYEHIVVRDADNLKYGWGATEVYLTQKAFG